MVLSQTDLLVQHSRRQLWVALLLVTVLGGTALFILAFPGSRDTGTMMMLLYPEIVIGALLALRRSKRLAGDASVAKVQAAVDDELRRQSLNLAWRNAFFAVMFAQPLLAYGVASSGTANAVAVMAGASALLGVVTVLASVLYYDR